MSTHKLALVTVGTTRFEELIRAVDTAEFAAALQAKGISELVIQKGSGRYAPCTLLPRGSMPGGYNGLAVRCFDFTNGLPSFMAAASLIISHAGSGSIFEALTSKSRAALVVVPNPLLMDNHQAELGEHLAAMGHVVCATPSTLAHVVATFDAASLVPYTGGSAAGIAAHIDGVVWASQPAGL